MFQVGAPGAEETSTLEQEQREATSERVFVQSMLVSRRASVSWQGLGSAENQSTQTLGSLAWKQEKIMSAAANIA